MEGRIQMVGAWKRLTSSSKTRVGKNVPVEDLKKIKTENEEEAKVDSLLAAIRQNFALTYLIQITIAIFQPNNQGKIKLVNKLSQMRKCLHLGKLK